MTFSDEQRQIAQAAAQTLANALRHWRGDAAGDSVASYVAQSVDHPWGRPRVVVGLDVDEALALAAALTALQHDEPEADGHAASQAPSAGTDQDTAEWHDRFGAAETIQAIRAEVTEITSYGQEATQDLDTDLPEIDIDNVQIALGSIHAASERALAQLHELHQP